MVYLIEIDVDKAELEEKLNELQPSRLIVKGMVSETLDEYYDRLQYDRMMGA